MQLPVPNPLRGLRIVEVYGPGCPLPVRLAGALAARLLADMGAGVSSVEAPDGNQIRDATTAAFLGAGKRVIGPASPSVLLAEQDGIITDTDYFASLEQPPRAAAALSMLPQAMVGLPSSELTVMALSGVLDIIGDPTRAPLRLGGHQAAYSAGLSAFTGLLAALCQLRNGADAPQTVCVNLLDTLLWVNWKSVIAAETPDGAMTRQGAAADWQVIRCADGWMALVYQDTDWPELRALVGESLDDVRFATSRARRGHRRELAVVVESALCQHTREEIRTLSLARGLPLGPVWSLTELLQDRHYLARGVFFPAEGHGGAMMSLPAVWNGMRFPPGAAAGR
jgi:crotonobetainyl-CoA:carnitine CoA-transferase CaiB-like acyl-CoA transferase